MPAGELSDLRDGLLGAQLFRQQYGEQATVPSPITMTVLPGFTSPSFGVVAGAVNVRQRQQRRHRI